MTKISGPVYVILGACLGVGLCALLIWNPAGWQAIDHYLGRPHGGHESTAVAGATARSLYTCSMHPQVLESEPGNCPICGMRLVSVASGTVATAPGERKVLYWRAPMDPNYTSDKPGKSPMGMDLVPVYEDEPAAQGGIQVSPSFLQNFAVRTTPVTQGAMAHEIRTVGVLSHNEENILSINTKYEGWIERARVNNVGEQVREGDLLFEIYSPQLVTTQQEYLAAREYVQRLQANEAYPDAITRAQSLVESARARLRYWDVTADQIAALDTAKKVSRTVSVRAPRAGVVAAKMGDSLEGVKVSPGMTILKLANHSTLWVEAEFYEDDLRFVREGQRVAVETDAFPGQRWSGKIVLFRPALNPLTRTLTALVEVANRDMRLRPQMYVQVLVRAAGQSSAVQVPAQAVLHSGERAIVIVEKATGLFEPREVALGMDGGEMQQITSGLSPGERVVTSSQFLIDSESNLKAAIAQLLGDPGATGAPNPAPPAGHPH